MKHQTRRAIAGMLCGIVVGYIVGALLAFSGGGQFGTFTFGSGVWVGSIALGVIGFEAGSAWDT